MKVMVSKYYKRWVPIKREVSGDHRDQWEYLKFNSREVYAGEGKYTNRGFRGPKLHGPCSCARINFTVAFVQYRTIHTCGCGHNIHKIIHFCLKMVVGFEGNDKIGPEIWPWARSKALWTLFISQYWLYSGICIMQNRPHMWFWP